MSPTPNEFIDYKALVHDDRIRSFLSGSRIEHAAGRATLRWYRLPRLAWVKLVAVGGIEPPTRGL